MPTPSVFLYGTLRHVPLLERVLGRPAQNCVPARLADHAVYWAAEQSYPLIVAEPGGVAEGLLLTDLEDAALARLDFYEGGFGYGLRPVTVATDEGPVEALVYFPGADLPAPGAPWQLADWAARWGEITCLAAQEAMAEFGRMTPQALAHALPTMRVRAAARLRARDEAATATLRTATPAEAVEVLDRRRVYTGFFAVDEHDLRFPRYNGTVSETVSRAAFGMGDAVTVLPYDPLRDRVLLIEQFRFGAYLRGDRRPWLLEPIAGRVDPGEDVETAARREALEEAGLTLTRLEPVADYYTSPAAVTEFLFSFVAPCALPDAAAGLGGLDDEHEDIRSHVLSFDAAMDLVRSGEAQNAPLLLSLFWLGLNRERLRVAG